MLPVELLPGAKQEFDESLDWYRARSRRTADRFVEAVKRGFAQIATNPSRFATMDGVHRELSVKKFPFRIIYKEETDRVVVVAIAHAKRRPIYWKKALEI